MELSVGLPQGYGWCFQTLEKLRDKRKGKVLQLIIIHVFNYMLKTVRQKEWYGSTVLNKVLQLLIIHVFNYMFKTVRQKER